MGDTPGRERGSVTMESVEEVKRKSKEKENRFRRPYGYEFRLRAVKLRLEEGIPVALLCKELGVGEQTLWDWLRRVEKQDYVTRLWSRGIGRSFRCRSGAKL
jgi:transposase-like protein